MGGGMGGALLTVPAKSGSFVRSARDKAARGAVQDDARMWLTRAAGLKPRPFKATVLFLMERYWSLYRMSKTLTST